MMRPLFAAALVLAMAALAGFPFALAVPAQAAGGAPLSGTARVWSGGDKPGFALEALAGGRRALAAERGRVVVVHFFATWCAPCRHELPALQRFAARFAGRPVTVLAISVGEARAPVERLARQLGLTLPVLLDGDAAVTTAWGVKILPTTWVLAPDLAPRFLIEEDYDWDGAGLDPLLPALWRPADPSPAGVAQP